MRTFSFALLLILAGCAGNEQYSRLTEAVAPLYDDESWPFYHGVASGDPLNDRVIIWTRVTPQDSIPKIEVEWQMADNVAFETLVRKGNVETSPETDYTVKVDVDGLQPGEKYYYRFIALGKTSPVGETKTFPAGDTDSLKFAVVSCSNWQHGYFNAYDRIADKDVDAVLHLGDYIYEYGASNAKLAERPHLPPHEIVTLADYRTRYSQYHLDKGLRKMRQQHPVITIWDDHELANNSYIEGAQNHQPENEGDFEKRKQAARRAYYEWIPIRENEKHYRAFRLGDLAEVIMLDERLEGKTKPVANASDPEYGLDERAMLGKEQLAWLEDQLKNSQARWKVIGNQVLFSDFDRSAVAPRSPRNMDSWDGYPAEKKRVADLIRNNNIGNVIFLTGDTHSSWAFEVVADPLEPVIKPSYKPIAVEFGTTSVSSSNSNESVGDDTVKRHEEAYMRTNPHLKFVNRRDHGYLLLTLTADKARADWFYTEILKPDSTEWLGRTHEVRYNTTRLR